MSRCFSSTILLCAGCCFFAVGRPVAAQHTGSVLRPISLSDNSSLFQDGDPAAHWWRWALSVSQERNPVRDQTGIWCGEGQAGRVWLLAGSFETVPIRRICHVPAGVPLFFPVINAIEADVGDCNQAMAEATRRIGSVRGVKVLLDDESMDSKHISRLRARNCFSVSGMNSRVTADGFWVMLAPLQPGKYKIHFEAEMEGFRQNITYDLVVGAAPNS